MTSILYKVTNKPTGKSLVGTFPGTFYEMQAAVLAEAQKYGGGQLEFQQLARSVNPVRSDRSFRAQSYLNGAVYLFTSDFSSLFNWSPAPTPPPVSTIPEGTFFTLGDSLTLTFVPTLIINGQLIGEIGLLMEIVQ